MYNLLYLFYFRKLKSKTFDLFYTRVITRAINITLPAYFYLTGYFHSLNKKDKSETLEKNIVSLTTFPARINKVWLTIETILMQNVKPDKIILWLYEGEFNGKASLPKNLLQLEKRGLEIRFCNENLMPHKKYYYTMLKYPEANVITVDDDMFYPPDLIDKLLRFHKKYPESIICTISRQIKADGNAISPYREWSYLKTNSEPDFKNLGIGVGGILYPSKSLHPNVLNIKELKKLALKADDLWLKAMSLKNNTKVVSMAGEYPRFFIPIIQKNNQRLMDSNIGEGQNDQIFKSLMEHYQIPLSIFKTELS